MPLKIVGKSISLFCAWGMAMTTVIRMISSGLAMFPSANVWAFLMVCTSTHMPLRGVSLIQKLAMLSVY